MSPDDRALVVRSLSLFERLELLREDPSSFAEPDARAHELLGKWEALLANPNDPGVFERRLAFDALDRETVLRALAPLTLPEAYAPPSWLELVAAVLDEMRASAQPDAVAAPLDVEGVPFVGYWTPWVRVALRRLPIASTLGPAIGRTLAQHLLMELARCGTQCLVHEFDLLRATARTGNDLFLERVAATPSTELYDGFIADLCGPKARAFLELFPCLARLAATCLEHWIRHLTELATRLERDRPELEARLGVTLETLEALDLGLSDAHNGGRSVVGLRFASGARLVYKPKELGTEREFQGLVARMNELGFEPRLRTITVLTREGYGWVEFVARAPCRDEAELADYYRRSGALVALVTFLQGTDCHFENVIASGGQPVLVDHEALFTPSFNLPAAADDALGVMHHRLQCSSLRTGLLPEWTSQPGGEVVDLSGIGARRATRGNKTVRFANVNSDGMALESTEIVMTVPLTNEPTADGTLALPPHETEAHVKDGFRRIYRLLEALGPDGRDALLAAFAGLPIRCVPRSTVGYTMLLRESRKPSLMRDGLVQNLALDRIARMLLGATERPAMWPLIRAEHVALARGDVPFFAFRTDETRLFVCDPRDGALRAIAEEVIGRSGLDVAREQSREMSEDELALELRLIACSFEGKSAGIGTRSEESVPGASEAREIAASVAREDAPLDAARATRIALGIAHEIRETALVYRGEHHRVGLEYDEVARAHRVALLGGDLYNGYAGIALFLGVASRVERDDSLRLAALDTLASMRALLRRDPAAFVGGAGIGGFEGVGGLVYAYAALGRAIEEPSLLDDARLIARSVTRAHVDRSPLQDVFSGTAGLLLALVALDRVAGSTESAPLIHYCGQRLVETAVARESGIGWPLSPASAPLCGMAHGNAGIAMALFEAWRSGGSAELRAAAKRALAYERALRDDDAKNWPDLRGDGAPGAFISAWCNGAPGIALARSRILAIEDDADLRADLAIAVAGTKEAKLPGGHLCCGMAGIDAILLEVGARTNDAALTEVARRRTMSRLLRSEREGRWPRVVVRGLMRGSAGIGLALLKMSNGGDLTIPSVLDLSL